MRRELPALILSRQVPIFFGLVARVTAKSRHLVKIATESRLLSTVILRPQSIGKFDAMIGAEVGNYRKQGEDMNRLLTATAALAALGTSAFAADMPLKAPPPPPAPVATWTGCHVGVNVGGGWTNQNAFTSVPVTGPTGAPNTLLTAPFLGSPGWGTALSNSNNSGIEGGGQIGCDYQTGTVVLGVETDFQGYSANGTNTTTFSPAGLPTTTVSNAYQSRTPWFGTVRGRIGTTIINPNFLAYVTGGFAYGREQVSDLMTVTSAGVINELFPFSTSATVGGYTVGGGLEWMFANHWQLRAEYLFVSLPGNPSQNLATAGGLGSLPTDAMQLNVGRDNLNVVRAAVDYKF